MKISGRGKLEETDIGMVVKTQKKSGSLLWILRFEQFYRVWCKELEPNGRRAMRKKFFSMRKK